LEWRYGILVKIK